MILTIKGKAQDGVKHFSQRIDKHPNVFEKATGEKLFAGTLNVAVAYAVPIQEHFRIKGSDIEEPEQDLLFEICRINGIWAYRIRPHHLLHGGGGHGDNILEIACAVKLRDQENFNIDQVEISFFR